MQFPQRDKSILTVSVYEIRFICMLDSECNHVRKMLGIYCLWLGFAIIIACAGSIREWPHYGGCSLGWEGPGPSDYCDISCFQTDQCFLKFVCTFPCEKFETIGLVWVIWFPLWVTEYWWEPPKRALRQDANNLHQSGTCLYLSMFSTEVLVSWQYFISISTNAV